MNIRRVSRLIRQYVEAFDLDLDGLHVFTEAATGPYAVTAPIASSSGAESVTAIAANSEYGTAEDAFEQTANIATQLGCNDRITYVKKKTESSLAQADIVTNTGFVRPLDRETIRAMKPTAGIPLMYEPWEFRSEDIDIKACWQKEIPILGTDESDERVRTQEYVGLLPIHIALENNIEVMRSKFLVVGSGRMAHHAIEKVRALGGETVQISADETADATDLDGVDVIVVLEHADERELIGPNGCVTVEEIEASTSGAILIHICGAIDTERLADSSVRLLPPTPKPVGYMSYTAGELGPQPVISLHAAGIKVGAILTRARRNGHSTVEAMDLAAETSLGSSFSTAFERKHGLDRLQ